MQLLVATLASSPSGSERLPGEDADDTFVGVDEKKLPLLALPLVLLAAEAGVEAGVEVDDGLERLNADVKSWSIEGRLDFAPTVAEGAAIGAVLTTGAALTTGTMDGVVVLV